MISVGKILDRKFLQEKEPFENTLLKNQEMLRDDFL